MLNGCAGQSINGRTSFYVSRTDRGNQPGSLSRPQVNAFLTQTTYHCSCVPQDFSGLVPHALTQQRPDSSRVSSSVSSVSSFSRVSSSVLTAAELAKLEGTPENRDVRHTSRSPSCTAGQTLPSCAYITQPTPMPLGTQLMAVASPKMGSGSSTLQQCLCTSRSGFAPRYLLKFTPGRFSRSITRTASPRFRLEQPIETAS